MGAKQNKRALGRAGSAGMSSYELIRGSRTEAPREPERAEKLDLSHAAYFFFAGAFFAGAFFASIFFAGAFFALGFLVAGATALRA